MAVLANRVTVGTSATRLDSTADTRYDATTVAVECPTSDLYFGGTGVTTATGFLVPAGVIYECELRGNDALYAVAAVAVEAQVLQRNGEAAIT